MADKDVNFVAADYNTDFASNFAGATFDCVIACEVIEHLDDPRRFLAQCAKLLSQNGIVIVSTPNIAFFEGRIKFLLTGELWGYGANNYKIQRHISPISREQFPLLFEECGFHMIQYETRGSFGTMARKVVTAPIWGPMRAMFGQHVLGESSIAVGRKSAAKASDMSSDALWGAGRLN